MAKEKKNKSAKKAERKKKVAKKKQSVCYVVTEAQSWKIMAGNGWGGPKATKKQNKRILRVFESQKAAKTFAKEKESDTSFYDRFADKRWDQSRKIEIKKIKFVPDSKKK